jgi:succinate dehydrogenase/fumarate reductase flavoprotein subunit
VAVSEGLASQQSADLNLTSIEELTAKNEPLEYDVVVVGGGGAGASAAVEATELGASVLVLEKADTPGGSTQESGGSLRMIVDRARSIEHYWHLTQGTTPKEVIEAFVDGVIDLPDWMETHDGGLAAYDTVEDSIFPARRPGTAFPDVPHADALGRRSRVRPMIPGRQRGEALWDFLASILQRHQVPVAVRSRVTRLVEDDATRRVVGVEVASTNGPVVVRARRGVVLSCGGYSYDPELMRQYLGVALPALSPPGRNAGDGIRLAQQVGADMWHMSAAAATVGYKFPEYGAGFWCQMPAYGFVMVDQNAERFVCETNIENHAAMLAMLAQDPLSGRYLRVPSYVIFDEETRTAGRLATLKTGENRKYPWSEDNTEEIERGWISCADTLEELANALGLPPRSVQRTVDAFNRCAESGVADSTGRQPDRMKPIAKPPFYGSRVWPTLVNTQGGPRRNARAAVLRPDGTEIPGLFGAGELGSIWNRLYPGAGNVSEAVVFGRLAGRSAANFPSI